MNFAGLFYFIQVHISHCLCNITEWISHYLWQGASHFYLIDNNSTDNWMSAIPPEELERITVLRNKERHIQIDSYNSLLPMLRDNHMQDWALIVDLDEFLYAKPSETVASYFSRVSDDIGQVRIPWYVIVVSYLH